MSPVRRTRRVTRQHAHVRRSRRTGSAIQLTPRDEATLLDLARFGALTAGQLRRRHFLQSRSLGTVWNRLRALRLAGYVVAVPIGYPGHAAACAYLPTARGALVAGVVGVALPATRHRGAGPVALRHALAVADVAEALLARRYQQGAASWVTERELRASGPTSASGTSAGDGVSAHAAGLANTLGVLLAPTAGTGWPDGVLVVTRPDGTVARAAVEVELHAKAPRRYAPKLAWYRRLLAVGALDRVWWYCATPAVAAAVRRAVQAAGGSSDTMTVELVPTALTAPTTPVIVPGA